MGLLQRHSALLLVALALAVVPVLLQPARGVVQSCGLQFATCTLADTAAGRTLRCFGQNTRTQLGFGSQGISDVGLLEHPVMSAPGAALPSDTVPAGRVQQLVCGKHFACVLMSSGQVLCWGDNTRGQLGQDTTALDFAASDGAIVTFSGHAAALRLVAGSEHACAVLAAAGGVPGAMTCWGSGSYGQLGINSRDDVGGAYSTRLVASVTVQLLDASGLAAAAPAQLQIAAGHVFSCAALAANRSLVRCWGSNQNGVLGLGLAQVAEVGSDDSTMNSASPLSFAPLTVELMAAGYSHVCVALSDNTLRCWGANGDGQLGLGVSGDVGLSTSALQYDTAPAIALPADGIQMLAAAKATTCILTNSGIVYCWGSNRLGELGQGRSNANYGLSELMGAWDHPVLLPRKAVHIASGCWAEQWCAVLDNGALQCWGDNSAGQLGLDRDDTPTLGSDLGNLTLTAQLCGDGSNDGEACDDANSDSGDGCSPACAVEFGWQCAFPGNGLPSACDLLDLIQADAVVAESNPEPAGADQRLTLQAGGAVILRFDLEPLRQQVGIQIPPLTQLVLECTELPTLPGDVLAALSQAPDAAVFDEYSIIWSNGGDAIAASAQSQTAVATGALGDPVPERNSQQLVFNVTAQFEAAFDGAPDSQNMTMAVWLAASASGSLECFSRENLAGASLPKLRWLNIGSAPGGGGGGGSSANAGAIAGGVVGGVVGLAALVCCCLCVVLIAAVVAAVVIRRRRANGSKSLIGGDIELPIISDIIPMSELKLQKQIGAGANGVVYRAVWSRGGVAVAVKRLSGALVGGGESAETRQMLSELELLKELSSPHTIRYYGLAQNGLDLLIVMELAERGSLDTIIYDTDKPLSMTDALRFARDAARGLAYLHRQNIVHRDIKPANMLVDASGVVKLADFGISRIVSATQASASMTAAGTPVYMAPEVAQNRNVAFAADVYSLGVSLWEMLSRQRPFSGHSAGQIIVAVIGGARPPLDSSAWPAAVCELIGRCWDGDATKRPSALQIVDELDRALAGE